MLFVAAIRGTQAVWRRLLSMTILHQQWGCKCRSFPVCGLLPLCAVLFLLSVCRRFFFHDANKDKSFKCVFQASLAQRLCSGAERGSVSQLSLYTSPSLPNITLGLPATATATAASNVRRKLLPTWLNSLQTVHLSNCEFVLFRVHCLKLFIQICPHALFSSSCPGDLSPAGWRPAAGPLPQPSVPLRWPLDPLLGRGWSRNRRAWCTQSPAPTHGAYGAESSAEPPGDR